MYYYPIYYIRYEDHVIECYEANKDVYEYSKGLQPLIGKKIWKKIARNFNINGLTFKYNWYCNRNECLDCQM